MNSFDAEQFRQDFAELRRFQRGAGVLWTVRRKWIGWTVYDPEGRVHLTVGHTRRDWLRAVRYAHHKAQETA